MRKDRFGQDICVGDYIIYPVKHSCTAAINFAKVLELVPYDDWDYVRNQETNRWDKFPKISYRIKCRRLEGGKVVVINNRNEIRINASVLPEEYK